MTNVKPSLFIPNETGYGAQFVTGTLGGRYGGRRHIL